MSDVINDLKKSVKVPIWAQVLGRYRAWQRRRAARKEFKHVATITHYGILKKTHSKELIQSWYILTERGDGKRSADFKRGSNYWVHHDQTWAYAHIVQPWLCGKYSNKQISDWANEQKVPSLED